MNGTTVLLYLLLCGFVGVVMIGGAAAAETNLRTVPSQYSVNDTIGPHEIQAHLFT